MKQTPGRGSLLVVFLTVFIDLMGFGMVIPLLPVYAKSFVVDESGWVIGLLMSVFSAMQFIFAPIWGRVSDHWGRRPVLIVGLAGSVVFYTLFGLATLWRSLFWLFVARIGAGIAGATISTAQAYIADVTTLETRARGMALIGAAFGLGFTLGPLLGAAALLGLPAEGAHDVSAHAAASPWPGYVAAILSAVALGLAIVRLPESLGEGSKSAGGDWFSLAALGQAITIPSMTLLLVTNFVTVLSFSNFESTLSLLLKEPKGGFALEFHQVLYAYAYVGLVLSIAQGVIVRRLTKTVPEGVLAPIGGVISILGYLFLGYASGQASLPLLLAALTVEVVGFAFLPPTLNSLISRRSDPTRQGGVLGVAQGTSSLARILGPVIGIRLFSMSQQSAVLPFWAAGILMTLALVLMLFSVRRGRDFVPQSP